jgi:alpha-mannosidase
VADGPVLARLCVTGAIEGIQITNFITVYAHLDRVDFDLRIAKPVASKEERLCQVFPMLQDGAVLRIETTGAVIRPRPQPEGDLLPGSDTRRFAVQGFIDTSLPDGPGVTIASLDAFVLRLDLDPITFEALGNDQNYREVAKDQNGVTDFRFRYSLRAHADGYNNAEAFAWSRSVATPLLVTKGSPKSERVDGYPIGVDPNRAIVTCLKPADENGHIVRLWETGGQSGPVSVDVKGYKRAFRTDLLERDIEELQMVEGKVTFNLSSHGLAGLRLLP